jgi:hypothetical protein
VRVRCHFTPQGEIIKSIECPFRAGWSLTWRFENVKRNKGTRIRYIVTASPPSSSSSPYHHRIELVVSPITKFATSHQTTGFCSKVWHAVCHCRTIVLLAFFITCSQSSLRPRLWCPRKHERWQCDNYWLIAPTRLDCSDFSWIIQYALVRFNKRWALSTWLAQPCCGLLFQQRGLHIRHCHSIVLIDRKLRHGIFAQIAKGDRINQALCYI